MSDSIFALFDPVRLVTNRFAEHGAALGAVGYVIEKYENGALEVEVSNPRTGETVAQFVAFDEDLERADVG